MSEAFLFEAPLLAPPLAASWWQRTWFHALLTAFSLGLSFAAYALAGPGVAVLLLIGLFWLISRLFADNRPREAGRLRLGPTSIELAGPAGRQRMALTGQPLVLKYGGYRGLRRGRVEFDGTGNYLQLGAAEPLRFLLRDAEALEQLRWLLQAWYEQRVPFREYHFADRTFLLDPNMHYDAIQDFKRRYGVSLYD